MTDSAAVKIAVIVIVAACFIVSCSCSSSEMFANSSSYMLVFALVCLGWCIVASEFDCVNSATIPLILLGCLAFSPALCLFLVVCLSCLCSCPWYRWCWCCATTRTFRSAQSVTRPIRLFCNDESCQQETDLSNSAAAVCVRFTDPSCDVPVLYARLRGHNGESDSAQSKPVPFVLRQSRDEL